MTDIQKELFAIEDSAYRDFHAKLVPTVPKDLIIGVRAPRLRAYAAKLAREGQGEVFLASLPHTYYEENNLHSFLLAKEKDFSEAIRKTEEFLPYIDNWATCDSLSPKVFAKQKEALLPHVKTWLASKHTYTVRFGIKMLMDHFLGDAFSPETMEMAANVKSEEYYVNMMIAWYFATALAKQEEAALRYIKEERLPVWVHNKAIGKAVESYRIAPGLKETLKSMRRKTR